MSDSETAGEFVYYNNNVRIVKLKALFGFVVRPCGSDRVTCRNAQPYASYEDAANNACKLIRAQSDYERGNVVAYDNSVRYGIPQDPENWNWGSSHGALMPLWKRIINTMFKRQAPK